MGNPPFEDVSPIRNGGFPASYVSLPEGIHFDHPYLRCADFSRNLGIAPWILNPGGFTRHAGAAASIYEDEPPRFTTKSRQIFP